MNKIQLESIITTIIKNVISESIDKNELNYDVIKKSFRRINISDIKKDDLFYNSESESRASRKGSTSQFTLPGRDIYIVIKVNDKSILCKSLSKNEIFNVSKLKWDSYKYDNENQYFFVSKINDSFIKQQILDWFEKNNK